MSEQEENDEFNDEFTVSFDSYIKLLKIKLDIIDIKCNYNNLLDDVEKCQKLMDEYACATWI